MPSTCLDKHWLLTCAEEHLEFAVNMPVEVHQVLLEQQCIPHPYVGLNESNVQWVAERTWQLNHDFDLSEAQLEADSLTLILAEVDTVADIHLNNQRLARVANQFRIHRLDLKEHGQVGKNRLTITLLPAAAEALKLANAMPFPIPFSGDNNQVPHINQLRKTQCHAGWDWGICLMATGVYQPPRIEAHRAVRIKSVRIEQRLVNDAIELALVVQLTVFTQVNDKLHITLGEQTEHMDVVLPKGEHDINHTLVIHQPALWWPNGYGQQPLHTLTLAIGDDVWQRTIGLRELTIVNERDDIGASLVVRVNGIDIFCKGANWIPPDALTMQSSAQRYRHLLMAAQQANMNMIRVWGGGQYERDAFYQSCDELGLLVWQDLMFACSQYPSTDEFLENVRAEIEDQVSRLGHHACIALWCGDNEVIGALNWYPETRAHRDRYVVNYDRLNRTLEKQVASADPTRRFWPSSPCNGELDFGDAWHDDASGDMHYWEVWHSGQSFDAYYKVKPRFCSEFGFQSLPSIQTVRQFADEDQLNLTSPVMENHQKNNRGNSIITEMLTRYFRFPDGFENTLYLSQVQQAVAIKQAVEYWRSLRPVCMGVLFWQLNDAWPVASWSSLEHSGRWKQLHYHAKRFYSASLITFRPTDDGEHWELVAINDDLGDLHLQGELVCYDLQGEVIQRVGFEQLVHAQSALVLKHFSAEEMFAQADNRFWVFHGSDFAIKNTFYFAPWKRMSLPRATIEATIDQTDEGVFVRLTTDQPAHFVTVEWNTNELVQGHFSDNSITLLPSVPQTIQWVGEAISEQLLNEHVTINHLRGSYH